MATIDYAKGDEYYDDGEDGDGDDDVDNVDDGDECE